MDEEKSYQMIQVPVGIDLNDGEKFKNTPSLRFVTEHRKLRQSWLIKYFLKFLFYLYLVPPSLHRDLVHRSNQMSSEMR